MSLRQLRAALLLAFAGMLGGCASSPSGSYDYSAFFAAAPRSILILPPVNNTMVEHASYAYLSTLTQPLVEQGYYVLPVELVDRVLKENGLDLPEDMHQIPLARVIEVFGADAVLYVTVTEYGSTYRVVAQSSNVVARLRLIDARSGELLWDALAVASSGTSVNMFSLTDTLVGAAIGQVISDRRDDSHKLSRAANRVAVSQAGAGLPFGPYHPRAGETP